MVAMAWYTKGYRKPKRERQPTQREKADKERIEHLQNQIDIINAMTQEELVEVRRTQWMPPVELLEDLKKTTILQCDRVEMIIVWHKADVHGDSPSWDTIATVLGIARKNAITYGEQLVGLGRAEYVQGKFRLVEGEYYHRILKKRRNV